jgi:hypothetical protein
MHILFCGSEKTVLIDSVDPVMCDETDGGSFSDVKKIDYNNLTLMQSRIIQSSIPMVLKRIPDAKGNSHTQGKGYAY